VYFTIFAVFQQLVVHALMCNVIQFFSQKFSAVDAQIKRIVKEYCGLCWQDSTKQENVDYNNPAVFAVDADEVASFLAEHRDYSRHGKNKLRLAAVRGMSNVVCAV
jgi:hypothetical protein